MMELAAPAVVAMVVMMALMCGGMMLGGVLAGGPQDWAAAVGVTLEDSGDG